MEIEIGNGRAYPKARPDAPSKKNTRGDQGGNAEHQHEGLDSLQRPSVKIIAGGLIQRDHVTKYFSLQCGLTPQTRRQCPKAILRCKAKSYAASDPAPRR